MHTASQTSHHGPGTQNRRIQLLLIEGDGPLLSFLRKEFEAKDYAVNIAANTAAAINLVESCRYDLIVFDISVPEVNGLELLTRLRSKDARIPILVLSSKREVEERVTALEAGADDHLSKPFAFSELCARAQALLRRSQITCEPVLQVHDLELRRVTRVIRRAGRQIFLTPKELALLEYLLENAGKCVTRPMIVENVWKRSPDTVTNVVDVYINYLRKKIDDGFEIPLIHTLRGHGYVIGTKRSELNRTSACVSAAGGCL